MNFTGDNCPIVAIILTHFHADHTFGLETFLKVLNKASNPRKFYEMAKYYKLKLIIFVGLSRCPSVRPRNAGGEIPAVAERSPADYPPSGRLPVRNSLEDGRPRKLRDWASPKPVSS